MKKLKILTLLGLTSAMLVGLSSCSAASSGNTSETNTAKSSSQKATDESKKIAESSAAAAESSKKAAEAKAAEAARKSNHIPAADAYATPAAQVQKEMTAPMTKGAKKTVYLTFDDGPNNGNTLKVLDILKKAGVHATFFIVGNQIGPNTAGALKRIYNEGHAIGLHSYDHTYVFEKKGDARATQSQIDRTYTAVRGVLGNNFVTGAWRYPGGHMSWARTLGEPDKVVAKNGLVWIDWNAASGDALGYYQTPRSVDAMLAYHLHSLRAYGAHPATVVLMHDSFGKDVTVKALPQIIDYYKKNGYQFGVIA